MSSHGSQNRKIAIPRLQNSCNAPGTMKGKRRVSRACTACRSHKIKCTGERPRCRHCASTHRECVYIMPRKDRLKVALDQNQELAGLLQHLNRSASPGTQTRVTQVLHSVEQEMSDYRLASSMSNGDTEERDSPESNTPHDTTYQEHLGTDALDLVDEDLHKDDLARATGFVGMSSEVQWLRSVTLAQFDRQPEPGCSSAQRRGSTYTGGEQVASFSYWMDGYGVDIDYSVDEYALPPPFIAESLFQCYLQKVHDSFPILPRTTFEHQFRTFFAALQNGNAPRCNANWQCTLNLVFAIAAKHSHLTKASWRGDERDHVLYLTRARKCSLDEAPIDNHPNISQIQSLGLLAFYWLSVGQVSRAWTVVGIALRCGFALGLHVRNEDPLASSHKKESLLKIWWSLYSLERILSIITGRPSIIVDSSCSVPLPDPMPVNVPAEKEGLYGSRRASAAQLNSAKLGTISQREALASPTSAQMGSTPTSYFHAVITLSIITQNILTTLYSAGTVIRSPTDLKQDIVHLRQRLDRWTAALPLEYQIGHSAPALTGNFSRERTLLGFQLCSASMLLARPYLTERGPSWAEKSEALFANAMANSGIEAAKIIISLLPEHGLSEAAYEQGPWWCLTHHIMQAISIFMLSLCYQPSHLHSSEVLFDQVKRGIYFLQKMRDPLSDRAHQIAFISLASVAKRLNYDISDLGQLGQLGTQDTLPFTPPEELGLMQMNAGSEYTVTPVYTAFDSAPMMPGGAILPGPYYIHDTGNN